MFAAGSISDYVDDSSNRCRNRVLQASGQLKKLRPPKWLDQCETLEDVLRQLKKRKVWPAVSVRDGKQDWFLIGEIMDVEPEGFFFRHYDANGKWDAPIPVAMPYVTCIEFDSPYVRHFGNYMKSKSRKQRAGGAKDAV